MKKSMDQLLAEIMEKVDQLTYVRPEEIPSVDLYMDQVLTFINERMVHLIRSPKEDKILTKTMVNNYTKSELLPAPNKKKYSKDHILFLLLIYYFKGVLSISDTGTILEKISSDYFNAKPDFDLEDIYKEVFSLEERQIEILRKDILDKFQIAEETFQDAPEEGQEYLKTFSFICLLCFDVYVKKMLIEKLVDGISDTEKQKKVKAVAKKGNNTKTDKIKENHYLWYILAGLILGSGIMAVILYKNKTKEEA